MEPDRSSGKRLLVDTGAEVSVLLPTLSDKPRYNVCQLQAANHTPISTYGENSLTLD